MSVRKSVNTSILEVSCFDTEHAEFAVCLIGVEERECTPKQNSCQDQMPDDQVGQISTGSHPRKERGAFKAVALGPDV